jgi:Skp family chaperone for outer membrane proteins
MKTGLLALSVLFVPAAFWAGGLQQPAPQPPTGVAMISGQRILAESPDARAKLAELQARQQQRTTEIKTKQQALEATRRQLAAATDPAKKSELQKQEQQQRTELERDAADAQSDLQASQRQLQADLRALLNPVLAEIAKGRNVQVILNSDLSVAWAAPGVDLTSEVLERLNARSAGGASKP